ncbi:MAG: MotA/TolQ/ExbB proton channel family protein [Bacteroidetes bacterium]|nr:MotA/TolQ/ExbB proton channel family protein [Bacteroidota bacterium]
MKKLTAFLLLFSLFLSPAVMLAGDVDSSAAPAATEMAAEAAPEAPADSAADGTTVTETEKGFREILKDKFIEGDYIWMSPILICLIIGLAVAIERIIYLNMATINTKKFLNELESALKSGGAQAALTVCQNTPGPVAGIFAEGLNRADEGIDVVEKAVVSYGGVEMGKMEKALPWLSLFIALAPMLGFLGTVIGMIFAFDKIEAAGDISPTVVAGGIKVALLTTVGGLIVAMILQIFYNYIMSKIEGLVNEMEEASVNFVDMLVKSGVAKSGNSNS